jgi:hypothetical protein
MLLEHRAVVGMGACERTCVRKHRAAAGIRLSKLADDQGLAGAQRLPCDTIECRAILGIS